MIQLSHSSGKIIAVIGPPASGKSYLARKLGEYYGAVILLEQPEKFPRRIRENLSNRRRFLETVLWFRNYQVRKEMKARRLKKNRKWVILDTFWLTSQLYIPCYPLARFETRVALELARLDRELLTWPDIIVCLKASKETLIRNLRKRDPERTWERTQYFLKLTLRVQEEHNKFLRANMPLKNAIIVKRKDIDFARKKDFDQLIHEIHRVVHIC